MKKIIYSLVIMIAAGSLFTSCIEQVEPEGILALREAKARYYDALSKLRDADREFRLAEAALKQAEAALKQAETAHQQAVTDAYTKMQALLREKQQLENEALELQNADAALDLEKKAAEVAAAIDSIEKALEIAEKDHEINLINKQKALAEAQESLRVALRNIELAAQDLTKEEKDCLVAAAAAYWEIWKEVQDQEIEVMKAENELAKAERRAEMAKYNPDMAWDPETHSYVTKIDSAKNAIARYQAFIAEDEDILANIPAYEDVEEWGKELAEYKEKATELEYNLYKVDQEIAYYYVNKVHDGIKTFNEAIDNWTKDEANKEVAEAGDEPKAPKKDDFKANTSQDSLKLADHSVDKTDAGFIIYKRFVDLVGELDDLQVPADANFKNKTQKLATITEKDGKVIAHINANYKMKDLIFGKEANWKVGKKTELKYKVQNGENVEDKEASVVYGAEGAISVLRRELVLAEEALDVEALEKAYKDAEETWKKDRAVLEKGLTEYDPYKKAKKALDSLTTENQTKGDAMVNAIKNLFDKLASVNEANLSKNDSVEIITAFAEFGAAREKYLEYLHNSEKPTKDLTPDGEDQNKLYYHFGKAKDASETINDSILFSALTYDALKGKWGHMVDDFDTMYGAGEPNEALGQIAEQLLGSAWGAAIAKAPATGIGWTLPTSLTKDAFYGEYEYVETPEPAHMKCIVPGHEADPYETGELTAAKKAVNDAIKGYMKIYNAYWFGHDYATNCGNLTEASTANEIKAAREKEIKVGIYTENTFCDPYTIASFIGNDIIYNDGLGTILAFIDPIVKKANAWDYKNGSNMLIDNTIFGSAAQPSTFAKYLKAKQAFETHGALKAYEEAIAQIEAWVAEWKAVFEAAEKADGVVDEGAYQDAVDEYNEDLADYNDAVQKHKDYLAKVKAFTGQDKKWTHADIKNLYKIDEAYQEGVAKIIKPFNFNPIVDTDEWKWVKNLGGELKTLAEACFDDMPAKFKAWQDELDEIEDAIDHNKILMTYLGPIYKASASLINHNKYPEWSRDEKGKITETEKELLGADFLALVDSYETARQKYIDAVNEDIAKWETEIDQALKFITDFESGVDPYNIAVETAKNKLQKANKELTILNELLKGAKENLDRIVEYLLSQDVNFINLSGYTGSIKI